MGNSPEYTPQEIVASVTPEMRKQFDTLFNQWKHDTLFQSNVTRMMEHPAYHSILDMKPHSIPLILESLRKQPGHIFTALNIMTGADVVGKEVDTIPNAINKWLEWGEEQGYLERQ